MHARRYGAQGTSTGHLGETRGISQGHLWATSGKGQDMKSRAAATWNGGLGDGSGVARLASGVGGDLPVSWASRTVEAGGQTHPPGAIPAAPAPPYFIAPSPPVGEARLPPERPAATRVCP